MKFILSVLFFVPTVAFAQTTYKLLAPLGPLTGSVTLQAYLEGILLVVIGVAGILAVLMIVICGIQMIGSPSVAQKTAAKECIWNAIFGLLLAMSSWIILNTINQQLLTSDFTPMALPTPPAPTPASPPDAPMPTSSGWYFRYRSAPGEPIQNSPRFESSEKCVAVMDSYRTGTNVIESNTAGGGTVECFQIVEPPPGTPVAPAPPSGSPIPPVGGGSETAARQFLCGNNSCVGARPVGVNKNACVGASVTTGFNCTNLAGMPNNLLQFVKDIASGSGENVIITGGTEPGHKTHFPGVPVFDMGNANPSLNRWIKANSTQSATSFTACRYRLTLNGTTFWMTWEGNHWHSCLLGQSSWYCRDVNRSGNPLPAGHYALCPR